MLRTRWFAAIPVLLLGLVPTPGRAWSEETRSRMIRQSLELMPTSLKSVLRKQEAHCIRGMIASGGEGKEESAHRVRTTAELEEGVEETLEAVQEVIASINRHESFRQIGYQLGVIAHRVADLNFPLNLPEGAKVPIPAFRRYQRYVEDSMERFPLVLDPSDPAALGQGDLEKYLRAIRERVRPYGLLLEEVFRLEAVKPDPARFDDRSVAFGIASLSYSRSLSDISRVWLYIWRQAQGDMEGVPFPLMETGTTEEQP